MTLIAHCGTRKISRDELATIPVPEATATHRPIPHTQVVQALIETLGFRHIHVVRDEYAVSQDGMRMFGALDLDYEFSDVRFSIGIRNANDKSMRLGMTIGTRTLTRLNGINILYLFCCRILHVAGAPCANLFDVSPREKRRCPSRRKYSHYSSVNHLG